MARREWAERKAKAGVQFISVLTDGEVHELVAKLLQAEHARAVRIVKRLQKNAERGGFGLAYGAALKDVLTALQKGRA